MYYINDPHTDFRYDIEAQDLHDRSRSSSLELRKLIVTLATGILGFSFILLTDNETTISGFYRWLLLVSLVSMGVTILVGLFAWFADAKRHYFWAKGIQAKKDKYRDDMSKYHKSWKRRLRVSKWISRSTFMIGIIVLIISLWPRIM